MQASPQPISDKVTLECCDGCEDGNHGLPEWRSGVNVFLLAEKLDSEGAQLLKRDQQMLGGSGKPVEAPEERAISL